MSNFGRKTFNEYMARLQMSRGNHLLVEGITDKELFQTSLGYLVGNKQIMVTEVDSWTMPHGISGNREKVITICEEVEKIGCKGNFAGFVDREFHNFDIEQVEDLLKCHYKPTDILVWSRGHSIENYLFEDSILSELLRDTLNVDFINNLIMDIEDNFESTMKMACALGISAYQVHKLGAIRKGVAEKNFKIEGGKIVFDIELLKRDDLSDDVFTSISENYYSYLNKLRNADLEVVRWLCDGHLGLKFILFTSCCCLKKFYQDNSSREQQQEREKSFEKKKGLILGLTIEQERNRHRWANWWARQTQKGRCEYPKLLLSILKISDGDI